MENKISDVSTLVKKTNYNTKISELEKKFTDYSDNKYVTTQNFNTSTVGIYNARLTQANLITITDFDTKLFKP